MYVRSERASEKKRSVIALTHGTHVEHLMFKRIEAADAAQSVAISRCINNSLKCDVAPSKFMFLLPIPSFHLLILSAAQLMRALLARLPLSFDPHRPRRPLCMLQYARITKTRRRRNERRSLLERGSVPSDGHRMRQCSNRIMQNTHSQLAHIHTHMEEMR